VATCRARRARLGLALALLLDADPTRDITATRRIRAVIHGGVVLAEAELMTVLDNARAAAAK
jgi:hypothetical protein